MTSFLIFLIGVVVFGFFSAKARGQPRNTIFVSRLSYFIFVSLLALSFLLGGAISGIFGMELDAITAISFTWVGVAASLPVSLLVARAYGTESYNEYWAYLTSFSNTTRTRITIVWIVATLLFVSLGAYLRISDL